MTHSVFECIFVPTSVSKTFCVIIGSHEWIRVGDQPTGDCLLSRVHCATSYHEQLNGDRSEPVRPDPHKGFAELVKSLRGGAGHREKVIRRPTRASAIQSAAH
jgi:hypothetical protein